MKLKKLLKLIPDECKIGITDYAEGVKIKNPPADFEERSKLRPSQYTIVS